MKENLIGKTFGRWTVIDYAENDKFGREKWKCKCECGTIRNVSKCTLINGQSKSCGCLNRELIKIRSKNNYIDLTDKTFGRLTALERVISKNGKPKWKCKCECGNIVEVDSYNLRKGLTKSCGCYQKEMASKANLKDLTGMRFGRLKVISFNRVENNNTYWNCICDCGNEKIATESNLVNGKTKSCGCLQNDLLRGKVINLVGERFGNCRVVSYGGYRYTSGGKRRHQWECLCDCGNTFITDGHNLTSGCTRSCGCKRSKGESELVNVLNYYNIPFEQQYRFCDTEISNLRFDFAILNNDGTLNSLIEFDGEQHFHPIKFCASWTDDDVSKNFELIKERDKIKNEYCMKNNIKLLRIPYTEFENIDDIITSFLKEIKYNCKELIYEYA